MGQYPEHGDLPQLPVPFHGLDLPDHPVDGGYPGGQQQHEQHRVRGDETRHDPERVQRCGNAADLLHCAVRQVEGDCEGCAHPRQPDQHVAPDG